MSGTVSIAAVGDIMLGDSFFYIGRGVRGTLERDRNVHPFEHVKETLSTSDVVVGNLESVLSDVGRRSLYLGSIQYRGKREYVKYLEDAHFSVLSLANNHSLEHGLAPMLETVRVLREAGIMPVGLPEKFQRVNLAGHVIAKNGVTLAFLSYCLNREETTRSIVASVCEVVSDVGFYRRLVDRIVVLLHWGQEYMSLPSPSQVTAAHCIIDAGADVILGHHPHVLQGIEVYRDRVIAYSLGNFVFDIDWVDNCRKSMVLGMKLSRRGAIEIEITPMYINHQYQPVCLTGKDAEAAREEIARLSEELHANPIFGRNDEEAYQMTASACLEEQRRRLHAVIVRQLTRLPFHLAGQIILRAVCRRLFMQRQGRSVLAG
jgi:poly-gamma-glutamate synthesis protein (capsule biosynthesis protein)